MRAGEEESGVFVVRESPWGFLWILLGATGIVAWGLLENWAHTNGILRVFLVLFMGLLWLMFFRVARNVTARFDRRTGHIDIARRGLLGSDTERYELAQFVRARVEEAKDSDGPTFRLVLVFSEAMPASIGPALRERLETERTLDSRGLPLNEVPLTRYLSSAGAGPRRAVAAINTWARAPAA